MCAVVIAQLAFQAWFEQLFFCSASPPQNTISVGGWEKWIFFFNSQTYGKRMTKCQIRYSYNYVAVKKLYPSKNQIAIITISCWSKVIGCFSSWTFFFNFWGPAGLQSFYIFQVFICKNVVDIFNRFSCSKNELICVFQNCNSPNLFLKAEKCCPVVLAAAHH